MTFLEFKAKFEFGLLLLAEIDYIRVVERAEWLQGGDVCPEKARHRVGDSQRQYGATLCLPCRQVFVIPDRMESMTDEKIKAALKNCIVFIKEKDGGKGKHV